MSQVERSAKFGCARTVYNVLRSSTLTALLCRNRIELRGRSRSAARIPEYLCRVEMSLENHCHNSIIAQHSLRAHQCVVRLESSLNCRRCGCTMKTSLYKVFTNHKIPCQATVGNRWTQDLDEHLEIYIKRVLYKESMRLILYKHFKIRSTSQTGRCDPSGGVPGHGPRRSRSPPDCSKTGLVPPYMKSMSKQRHLMICTRKYFYTTLSIGGSCVSMPCW